MENIFKIIDFSEKEMSFPTPSSSELNEIEIEIKPLIRYSNKRKVINIQLEVSFLDNKDNTLLNYGMAISYGLIDKNKTIDFNDKDTHIYLISTSLGIVRGAMTTYTKNTSFKKYILPLFINPENLLEKAIIIDMDNQE